jgi:hypothetical protein
MSRENGLFFVQSAQIHLVMGPGWRDFTCKTGEDRPGAGAGGVN